VGLINRGVIVVKPKKPFLDWLRGLPDPVAGVTLENLRSDCNTYLLPEWDTEEDLQELLVQCCGDIFAVELEGWCTYETKFPTRRSWSIFRDWFDIEAHSMVVNLVQGAITDDEDASGSDEDDE
jgi:hypothetical protein